jgi:hypothetical protein
VLFGIFSSLFWVVSKKKVHSGLKHAAEVSKAAEQLPSVLLIGYSVQVKLG